MLILRLEVGVQADDDSDASPASVLFLSTYFIIRY